MVALSRYLSRVAHLSSFALFTGHSAIKVMNNDHTLPLPKAAVPVLVALLAASGIYNVILARPKTTMGANRTRYNAIVYLKFILFCLHPAMGAIFGKGTAAQSIGELTVLALAFSMASYMRFYREEHTINKSH